MWTVFQVIVGMLSGCTSEGYDLQSIDKSVEKSSKYLEARDKTKKRLLALETVIEETSLTRNQETLALGGVLGFITSLSSSDIEVLKETFKVDETIETHDSIMQCILIGMEELSSSEELAGCLEFVHDYIATDGAVSLESFDELRITSDILKQYIITAVGAYDEIASYFKEYALTRGSYEYCLHQLEMEMAQSFVSGIAMDSVIDLLAICPGVDVGVALLAAGYDLVSSLKMAENFNKCLN